MNPQERTKVCRTCRETKPLSKFKKDSRCREGRAGKCYTCISARPSTRAERARYDGSIKGKARRLVAAHGYSHEDAAILAAQIFNQATRCAICGLPERWREAKQRDGWSDHHFTHRLSVDHIDPHGSSTLSNTRILCMLCNRIRGAAQHMDTEVLLQVLRWYEKRGFTPADLWWFNHIPGTGGMEGLGR